MNSIQIQCFLKAAEYLNFTEAAASLHISQPAFSRNIALLENEWAVTLFLRNKKQRSTQLTSAGKAIYDGLSVLMSHYNGLLKSAQSIHNGKTGSLMIGIIINDCIDERTLRVFDQFQLNHPEVELTLRRGTNSELIKWLHTRAVDISFILKIDTEDKDWIESVPLYSVDSALFLTANHPLLSKADLSLSDFKDDTFLSISSNEFPAHSRLLIKAFERIGLTPKVLETANISEQFLALESGKGIAIGSINNMAGFNTRIKTVSLPELRPLELVCARNRENENPCITTFISVMSS